jgi:hypothetical protein
MARIVVDSPNLTQPLLLYPGLRPAMLKQHRRSLNIWQLSMILNIKVKFSNVKFHTIMTSKFNTENTPFLSI